MDCLLPVSLPPRGVLQAVVFQAVVCVTRIQRNVPQNDPKAATRLENEWGLFYVTTDAKPAKPASKQWQENGTSLPPHLA